jgi:hypothetical protein
VSYDVEGPEPVAKRSLTKPIRTAIVLGLLAVAVIVAGRWGWEQLTQPFDDTASAAATPSCTLAPEDIATLPPPNRIVVNVYNASGIDGLAGETADELRRAGFEVAAVDNDPQGDLLSGVAEIRSSGKVPNRVTQLQRYVPQAETDTDDRPGRRLDLVLGSGFDGIVTPEPVEEGATENTEDDIPTC